MGKKKINAKNNIREFPYEGVRRDNRIKELAKKLKINPYQLKDLVNQKLKPGIKVMGKRFFSNVDTMAGYLNEVGKKNLANTPRSEIKRIYDPAMDVYGITDAQKLKYLSKVHDIHPSVIKDALKAGANPKSLINTMMHETLPSESISKWFRDKTGEKWKESNERKRSAKEIKNKIVKFDQPTTEKSLQKKIDNIEKKIVQNEVSKANIVDNARDSVQEFRDAVRDERKKLPKNLQKNRLNLKSKFKKSPSTRKWTPGETDLDKKVGMGKTTFGRGKESGNQSGDMTLDDYKTWKKKSGKTIKAWEKKLNAQKLTQRFLAPNIPKSSRLKTGMAGGVKGDVMSTAASIIADVLGERVIDPLTKKLVEKTIGPQLIKIRKENDKRRKRKQSL